MICISCGTKLGENSVFCHICGKKAVAAQSPEKKTDEPTQEVIKQPINEPVKLSAYERVEQTAHASYGNEEDEEYEPLSLPIKENDSHEFKKLMTRGLLLLEDGEWERAFGCFDEAYTISRGKSIRAYLARLCAEVGQVAIDVIAEVYSGSCNNDYEAVVCMAETGVGHIFLFKGLWEDAYKHFERALDIDPEYARAHLGKFFVESKLESMETMFANVSLEKYAASEVDVSALFKSKNFQRAERFADDELKAKLESYKNAANELNVKRKIYLIEEEREKREKARAAKIEKDRFEKNMEVWKQQGLCIFCGGTLVGFTKKCQNCGKGWMDRAEVAQDRFYEKVDSFYDRMDDKVESFYDRMDDKLDNVFDKFDNSYSNEHKSEALDSGNGVQRNSFLSGHTVFAKWGSGYYYYPATISEVAGNKYNVQYFDGARGTVGESELMDMQVALNTFELEGNWKNYGRWYKGKLSDNQSMVMNYADGGVEKVELKQLRGLRH